MTRAAVLLLAAGAIGSGSSAPHERASNTLVIPNYDLSQVGSFRLAPGNCAATSEIAGKRYSCRGVILLWRTQTPTGDITIEVWDKRRPSSELAVTGVMEGTALRVLSAYSRAGGQRRATGTCRFVGTMPPGFGPISMDDIPDDLSNRAAAPTPVDDMAPPDGEPDNMADPPDDGDNMSELADADGNRAGSSFAKDSVTRVACEALVDGRRAFYFDFTQRE